MSKALSTVAEPIVPVIEPTPEVHSPPPMTPLGEIYNKALAKEQGKEPEPAKEPPVRPAKEPEGPKGVEPPLVVEKPTTKPTNALDAVLETKTEEKKEPEPDPLADFPEEPQEGAKRNWKGLRGVAQKALEAASTERAEKERLLTELEAAKSSPKQLDSDTAQKLEKYDAIAAENAQLRDAITAVSLELLPEFRQEFIEGRKTLVVAASEKVKAYGGNSEALVEALSYPEGRRRDEAVEAAMGEEMTEAGKTKIRGLIAQIEAKDEARQKQLSDPQNSFKSYEERVASNRQKQTAQAQIRRQSEIETVIKSLPEISPFFKPAVDGTEGKEEWDVDLAKVLEFVPKDLGPDMTLREAAINDAKGRRFDFVAKKLSETYAELKTAKAQLAEYDTAQPDAKGRTAPIKTDEEAKMEKSPGQIYRETLGAGHSAFANE